MGSFDVYCALDGALDGAVICDEKMSRHVTYRVGGPVDLFIECASLPDLTLAIDTLREAEIPWSIIGKGSNLLVSDDGIRGAVIVLGEEFKHANLVDDHHLVAGAGITLANLVQQMFKQGYSGFEFAVGIPGTLGGAIYMNAGTRTDWIGSRIEALTVYSVDEGLRRYMGFELPWSYRHSGIPRQDIVLEAEMSIAPGDLHAIRSKMEASLNRRKKSQPLSLPSAGSIFRNPEGDSAGRLIESVGLKGHRIGDAQISELHANFIVNLGRAKASDIIDLMVLAQSEVRKAHGIELQPEVKFLGFE